METKTKCGDDCKLVEMLATKTSKQKAMENAEALYFADPENISIRGAAKQCGVDHSALAKRIKKKLAGTVWQEPQCATQPESKKDKSTAPDDAERDEWWADHQEGMSYSKIAKKHGRHRTTITKEIKRREEAEAQPEPTPEPIPTPSAPEPTPAPSVPSAESSAPIQWADHPRLKGWNGKLNDEAQQLYKREVASSRSRVRMAEQLAKFKLEIEKSMRAASKTHRVKAGALLETDVAMVEAALQRENRPGIKETLEAVIHESERIQKYANETLRILQLRQIDERGIAKT
tara:strand:- start:344 stop:1210 length:867 start_codon:yes stop_codon:yes gene_type:complete